jgi:hypothetical protein
VAQAACVQLAENLFYHPYQGRDVVPLVVSGDDNGVADHAAAPPLLWLPLLLLLLQLWFKPGPFELEFGTSTESTISDVGAFSDLDGALRSFPASATDALRFGLLLDLYVGHTQRG